MPTYISDHIISAFRDSFSIKLSDHYFAERMLRGTDPQLSVGATIISWQPEDSSAQISQIEPALGSYMVRIQNMVKHVDEEKGRKIHNVQNALIRAILYRDQSLRVSLIGVEEELEGSVERIKRMGVKRQEFLSNQVSGSFLYLCATEVYVETEVTLL